VKIKNNVFSIPGLGFTFNSKDIKSFSRKIIIIFFYRLALKHDNQFIIFQNSNDPLILKNFLSLNESQIIQTYGSGVDLKKFKFHKLPAGLPIIMIACRINIDKGIREFISAAKQINQNNTVARFVIVGQIDNNCPTPISTDVFNKLVRDAGVEYWGFYEEMHKIIPKCTIAVLPSYYEGMPKFLLEAAACGRPIIATNIPGNNDIVKHGVNGLLVEPKNASSLRIAIEFLINNKNNIKKFSVENRNLAKKLFSLDNVVKKHLDLYGSFEK